MTTSHLRQTGVFAALGAALYLVTNPASGLVATNASRNTFSPSRFLPPTILTARDQWMVDTSQPQDIAVLRRRAIRAVYRYSGVRLAELA